jgi:hypothetical protein
MKSVLSLHSIWFSIDRWPSGPLVLTHCMEVLWAIGAPDLS